MSMYYGKDSGGTNNKLLPIILLAASAVAIVATVILWFYGIYFFFFFFFFFFLPLTFSLPWSIKRLRRRNARNSGMWKISASQCQEATAAVLKSNVHPLKNAFCSSLALCFYICVVFMFCWFHRYYILFFFFFQTRYTSPICKMNMTA
jgi:hypothetical protein